MENRSASLECKEANSYCFGASGLMAFGSVVYIKGSIAFCFAPSQRKAKKQIKLCVLCASVVILG
jgi:hypothetical protein